MADDDDIQWQEEFKVRVSSGFDRLVAFAATELNRRSIEEERLSPKREIPPYVDHYHRPSHHMKKEDVRKMKPERDYASDLSNERRMRMMIEENRKSKHHLQHQQQDD